MSIIDKTFCFQSVVKAPSFTNFNPQYFFKEDNPFWIEMVVEESFRKSFLECSHITRRLPKTEVRGIAPVDKSLSDWEILSKIEKLTFLHLAHIALLLVNQPKKTDPGPLIHQEGKNYFFVPTPNGGVMKRVRIVDKPFARSWVVGADDLESLNECTPNDRLFVCWSTA